MLGTSAGRLLAVVFSAVLMAPAGASTAAARDPLTPVWVSPLKGDSDFSAIVAPDAKNVWAFGTTRSAGKAKPLTYRKSGSTWKRVRLPSGLNGRIQAADASSASNIWAVGGGSFNRGGSAYLLHWNGERWKLARRWKSALPLTIAATGRRGVWVFDFSRPRALHFDGRRWHKVETPVPVLNAAARGKTAWASGPDGYGKTKVMRFDGRRWKLSNPDALLPKHTKESMTFFGEPAFAGENVWMVAHRVANRNDDNPKIESFLLRHGNGRWRKEKISSASTISYTPVPDGRGGLWLLTSKNMSDQNGDLEYDLVLAHRTATGRWNERFLGHVDEETAGISEFVRIPGTQRLLGVGSVEPPGRDENAAIFELS
ncbi:hypothetical protein [Actinocorallia populi]|uniref:hypothetical protein n=1 Tax=Actinocorallia populi TaxID=2079200 RepID=UPI001300235C|nr:hypothetical protein [Actinocorallia populi]